MKPQPSTRLARLCRTLPIAALIFTALGPAAASAQAASYALSVSAKSSRAGASALQGRSLSGSAYVFTAAAGNLQGTNPAGVAKVCFWLDDMGMSGPARRCEASSPFDFAGSVDSSKSALAFSWDTTAVKNGTHTITQLVTRTSGATEAGTAMFAVVNVPAVRSLGVSPAAVTGGWPSTGTVTLAAASPAGGTSISLTSSSSVAQLPASVGVPAGSTSATFGITTSVVSSTTRAVITGASTGAAVAATLTVNPAVVPVGPAYALAVSSASSRIGARGLQGQALAGMAYLFTSSAASLQAASPAGIGSVCFWLDDLAMSGAATRCETSSPYDFAGSVSNLASSPALPWDTTTVVDGAHTVTQLVTLSSGMSEVDAVDFTVRNVIPAIDVAVTPNPATTTPGGTVSFQAVVTGTTAGQSTAVTWSVPAGGGSIGGTTGVYAAPATPGSYLVTATSVADVTRKGTATVLVSSGTSGGPTADSASRLGPYQVQVYASGIPTGANYVNPSIYFPTDATPPYPGAIFVPGLCETYDSRATQPQSFTQWGTFLASHGFIVMFVDSGSDGCLGGRSAALIQGMATLTAENTRSGSPLRGKVDTARLAVMGHSFGGSAALYAASASGSPALRAAVGLCPVMTDGDYPTDGVPSLLLAGQGDPYTSDTQAQYLSIPTTTSKLWALFAPVSTVWKSMHHVADTPLGTNVTDPVVARYGLSFLEVYVVGDLRYRQFLVGDGSLAGFQYNP